MKTKFLNRLIASYFMMTIAAIVSSSCDALLEVDPSTSKIPAILVFSDDASANSAAVGMYIGLLEQPSFASGSSRCVHTLAGLSADELVNIPSKDHLYLDFQNNNVSPLNDNVLNLWGTLYKSIYSSNSLLEGLSNSTGVSEAMKNQLRGEALFLRGFCYFYLTNLFGDVPIVLTTNFAINARLSRSSVASVYSQIKTDITEAEDLLPTAYVTAERTRANKFAATCLLARVYLYSNDLARAEDKASKVISSTGQYSITAINNAFLANNVEAIWQLRSLTLDPVTNEAIIFSLNSAKNLNGLRPGFVKAFTKGDLRKKNWISGYPDGNDTLWLPAKYKRYRTEMALPNEYSVVLRLAEVYLIRAEVKAKQDRLAEAIADLDIIRSRAGLSKIADTNPNIGKDELLLSIELERQLELFTEWGHRWLDLKRSGRATSILGPIKSEWSDVDLLYPIPETEISKNTLLRPQNPGY